MKRLLAAVLAMFLVACGASFQDVARGTVNTAGEVLVVVDQEVATSYTQAAREALEASSSLLEYEERIDPWDDLVDFVAVAEVSLRALESLINSAEYYSEGQFIALLVELMNSFVDVSRAMESLGVDIPESLSNFLDMAEELLGGGR